jgi:cytochrome c biogenesis protein ResB
MNEKRIPDAAAAFREALERLRLARFRHESEASLNACHEEVQERLEAIIRQTRPRAVRTFRN